jgi:hypothetical protein
MKKVKYQENKITLTDEENNKEVFILDKNPSFELGKIFILHNFQYYFLK